MTAKPKLVVCLMGPTASGKTPLAVELVQRLPCEIISVDSAMIYRGMDIGTAKPDAKVLKLAPHRLIDIRDPAERYSAGQFRNDALREIEAILAKGKIPLLVGGTMMYFRILQQGMAMLPKADAALRQAFQSRAETEGWEALHKELAIIDPEAAKRIHPNDTQRIQRALEVFMLTGKPISEVQENGTTPLSGYQVVNMGLTLSDRSKLHERIATRFQAMLSQGFIHEVHALYSRGDLSPDFPSMRSVGYRQAWDYVTGLVSYDTMQEKAITATRQLAKRQLTWLRSWSDLHWLESENNDLMMQATHLIEKHL